MKAFRKTTETRIQRLDRRQESRRSLILIMLMSLATVSVMATTQALSRPGAAETGILLLR